MTTGGERPVRTLVVFAREPVPGRVKTRLAATLGARVACELYRAFLEDVARAGRLATVERRVWCVAGGESNWAPPGYAPRRQGTGDLGSRLEAAFEAAFAEGAGPMVAVGSDAPTLSPGRIDLAFEALARAPVVLGPALDGGYYLVGLSSPFPEAFRGIPWSTDRVLEATLAACRRGAREARLLEPLGDVDGEEDLGRLAARLALGPDTEGWFPERTAQILRSLGRRSQ